eukprot:scaffold19930_cov115-Isochrysis_galbana.AAC.3
MAKAQGREEIYSHPRYTSLSALGLASWLIGSPSTPRPGPAAQHDRPATNPSPRSAQRYHRRRDALPSLQRMPDLTGVGRQCVQKIVAVIRRSESEVRGHAHPGDPWDSWEPSARYAPCCACGEAGDGQADLLVHDAASAPVLVVKKREEATGEPADGD